MVSLVKMASVSPVTVVANESELSATDKKVAEVKAKILDLTTSLKSLGATCDALRGKLVEFGVRPNCSVPSRFGTVISNEPGELGELETEMFALQKKQFHLSSVAKNLEKQLATAEFDKKVADATANVKELEALDKELSGKIAELKRKLAAEGKSSNVVVPRRMGVIVSNEKAPLGSLKTQGYALQKEIRYKKSVIKALESKLS